MNGCRRNLECITTSQYDHTCKSICCCNTHTHTHLTALFPGLPGYAGTRKVKQIWILLKREKVSGSGIIWAVCKFAPRSRQITTPAPHHSVFTGRMPFLPPNQQHQSTEGTSTSSLTVAEIKAIIHSTYSQIDSQTEMAWVAGCVPRRHTHQSVITGLHER